MDEIKVIHLDTEPNWRGGQQQAIYLFEGMLKRGYETLFFCKPESALHKYIRENNLPHKSLALRNEIDILSAHKLAKFAKENKYNIIHCHNSHSLSIALIAKLFNNSLNIIASRRVFFPISNNILSKYKYNSKNVKKIVCVSNAVKELMIKTGVDTNKLSVIHSGIDLNKFQYSNGDSVKSRYNLDNSIVIGTVAAFTSDKDYPNLIEAAALICERYDNVIFLALGEGTLLENMKLLAQANHLNDKFIFAGHRKDVGDYLKAMDIFVLASKKEGLGTSILDAMSVGLPIIATDTGGIPEAVENDYNGLLVPPKNHKSLAEAILKLTENQQLRANYGNNSLLKVKDFDIENTIKQNINLYEIITDKS